MTTERVDLAMKDDEADERRAYSGRRFDNHFWRRRWASRCFAFLRTLGFS